MKKRVVSFTNCALFVIACMVALSTALQSQMHPYFSGGLGISGDYVNPIPAADAGIEYSHPRFLLDAGASYAWSRKPASVMLNKSKGDFGYSVGYGGSAYLRLRGWLLVGGGVTASHTVMSDAVKGGVYPEVGGGYEVPRMRFLAAYFFPGEKRNGVQGFGTSLGYDLARHLRFATKIDVCWFYPTDQPNAGRMLGGEVGIGLEYRF